MLRVITNFTVVEEDHRGRQIGFRNLFNGAGDSLVEVRISSSEVATIPMEDFKKLVLAGERLSELLAQEESKTANTTEAQG